MSTSIVDIAGSVAQKVTLSAGKLYVIQNTGSVAIEYGQFAAAPVAPAPFRGHTLSPNKSVRVVYDADNPLWVSSVTGTQGELAITEIPSSVLTFDVRTYGVEAVMDPLALNSLITKAHGLSSKPIGAEMYLECKTAEAGYAIGDRIALSSVASITAVTVSFDATNTYIAHEDSNLLNIVDRATAFEAVDLTVANWKLTVLAYILENKTIAVGA